MVNCDFRKLRKGIGIGGWLTNYKRFAVLPDEWKFQLTKGDYEHFHTYITEKDVHNIAKLGFDHVRLGFDQFVIEESESKFRDETINLIVDFVGWCTKYNLYVVLNMHKAIGNYCDVDDKDKLVENVALQNRFIKVWEYLEKVFSKYDNVAFELLNEPKDLPEKWNDLAEKTIAALHKINKKRILIIGCSYFSDVKVLNTLKIFDDDYVAYTFHFYHPACFTAQQAVLFAPFLYQNRKIPYPGDVSYYREFEELTNGNVKQYDGFDYIDSKWLYQVLQPALEFKKKYPDKILWLGEFGCIRHIDIKYRENYFKDIISFAVKNDIPYCVWNYLSTPNDGNRYSLVDDNTRKFISRKLKRICLGKDINR